MIILTVLFRSLAGVGLVTSANTIPHDPLSLVFFVGFPLLSVAGLMAGTSQMYQAHASQ